MGCALDNLLTQQKNTNGHQFECPVVWIGGIEHGQHASWHPNGLYQSSCGGIVWCDGILTEINRVVILSTGWECKNKRIHEHFYVIQLLNWGRCHQGTSPESYIKQIRSGWPRQLWPNILVHACRNLDLSANSSGAPGLGLLWFVHWFLSAPHFE